ncbi:histidine triad protein D [Streptococcus pneumoniae]|nr:histidine triad protein D [Streptococcus pneumoniae]
MTSHGDHYHYYNGKVPYDAIISEELLMKDPNYQLKDSDIVNEIKGGYVIKVNGKYYVYLKDAAHADNIRTKEEIKRQKQERSHNHNSRADNALQPEPKDVIQRMMGISSMHLISLRTRVMLISFLTATITITFLRMSYQLAS